MNGLHESEQILSELDTACKTMGSRAAWAERHEVSPALVSDVLNRRRDPSRTILRALGYERVVMYRKLGRAPQRKRV